MSVRLSRGEAGVFYSVTFLVMMFVLAPLLVAVALSFSTSQFASFPPKGFTLDWYWQVLADPEFRASASLSIGLALAATLAALSLGVPAAVAFTRSTFPGKRIVETLLLSPMIFPVLITGLALLQFNAATNMHDALLNLFFGHALVTLPYVVRTSTASLLLVDHSLEEAARTLGANHWRTFRLVTLPQITPGVAAGALFAFMISLDNYPISMWLADGRAVPLPVLLFQDMQNVFDPSIAAMASLMILVGAAAVLALEKLVGLRRAMGS